VNGENYIMRSLLLDQIKKNDMGGICSTYGKRKGTYRNLVGKPDGKSQLRRTRRGWEDNIKWVFRKWNVEVWTGLI